MTVGFTSKVGFSMLDDLLFTTNAVMPIVAMVAVGYFLKRLNIITRSGAKEMNKLVFKLFLPILLFLNVYNIESVSDISFWYIGYVFAIVVLIFFAALFTVGLITKDSRKKGAWVQATSCLCKGTARFITPSGKITSTPFCATCPVRDLAFLRKSRI